MAALWNDPAFLWNDPGVFWNGATIRPGIADGEVIEPPRRDYTLEAQPRDPQTLIAVSRSITVVAVPRHTLKALRWRNS